MIPILNSKDDLSRIFDRSQLNMNGEAEVVKRIVRDVRLKGDEALFEYTERFDGIKIDKNSVEVSDAEKENALRLVPQKTLEAMRNAKTNIVEYHKRQLRPDNIVTVDSKTTGWMYRPVERAGIYVPGGKAAYPSSVLMCALPALVAGVDEIIMVTPAGRFLNPLTIAAAVECGVKRIFKVGGAQGIAAMAFGTDSIPKADVISGPGNIYVTLAKKEVYGYTAVDMIAGPSEILVIADDSANAEYVAADMLSQAEHDELAMSVLLTPSDKLAKSVQLHIAKMLERLERKGIAEKSINRYGTIVVTKDLEEAVALSNKIAPEHLELCVKNSEQLAGKIRNAGALFVGNYSPEPLGDYYAGPNHVLPTSGTARYFSVLSVDNYLKKISYISYAKDALRAAAEDIINLADTEGLTAHANTIKVRFKL